ncbi:hypothetical protein ACFWBI_37885 [Streptomyces sp. NPDC059982]|uniref:hypothetical protein n=1 Tax=Streptomyces sp. NPDC059982 TaxID=3347024 RepID=UPI0036BE6543
MDDHVFIIGGIAAAWARLGLRVLLLSEREHEARVPKLRRVKGEWVPVEPPSPPGSYSTPLWNPFPHQGGRGRLAEQNLHWYETEATADRSTESPLRQAVAYARESFDLIVLLPSFILSDLWHPFDVTDHFVAIAGVGDLPRVERRIGRAGAKQVVHRPQLTPQQSAAVLRDRHLGFLSRHGVAIHGLVCHGSADARAADPDFYDAVAQDMSDGGVPLLGWVTQPERLIAFGSLPAWKSVLEEHGEGSFVAAHTGAARGVLSRLGAALPAV